MLFLRTAGGLLELVDLWRRHFAGIVQSLRHKGVDLPAELRREEEEYVARRREWHLLIAVTAASLGYRLEEILPEK